MRWFVYTLHDPRDISVVRYVGWTTNPARRLRWHIRDARNGKDRTRCGNWKRMILAKGLNPVMAIVDTGFDTGHDVSERKWIAHYRSDKLTNLTDGGDGTPGRTLSPEQRARISAFRKGQKASPEARENMRLAHLGRKHTPEQTAKIVSANTGRKQSEEERSRRRGKKDPKSVEKSAAARRGQKRSLEFSEKMRKAMTGRTLPPERVAKVRAAHLGSKRSLETKRRISEAVKAWHAKRKERDV